MRKKTTALAIALLLGIVCTVNPLRASQADTIKSIADIARLAEASFQKNTKNENPHDIRQFYHEQVQKFVDIFITRQKSHFAKMLGLAKYYFPIYEKIFRQRNVPDDIKYLSIVESSLNPHAVSRSGATGPWQFMPATSKYFDLKINEWVDERKDPELSCNAAATYLLESYDMYNDWLVAIASYNCGRGRVKYAINKAGGSMDFWSISPYLPAETRNYVPAFIATVYVMENHMEHGIFPKQADIALQTDAIPVNRKISLKDVARALEMDADQLSILNPSFKKQVINASKEHPKTLILPSCDRQAYSTLYEILNGTNSNVQMAYSKAFTSPEAKKEGVFVSYKVQQGDTLRSIAKKFNGTEDAICIVNKISRLEKLRPGMILKISST